MRAVVETVEDVQFYVTELPELGDSFFVIYACGMPVEEMPKQSL